MANTHNQDRKPTQQVQPQPPAGTPNKGKQPVKQPEKQPAKKPNTK